MTVHQAIHTPLVTTFSNLKKNADRLIKKDPVRAIVELVTNSDDSYRELEKRGIKTSGRISVEIIRARPNSIIEVIDEAEGMDANTMHRVVRLVGKDDNEVIGEIVKRGFFREGLKFAMIGMGYGSVTSVKGNKLYRCSVDEKGMYHYDPADELTATPVTRELHFRAIKGNGTIGRIVLSREEIHSLPLFDKIADSLSNFFSLRDLLSNPKREVYLVERDRNHKEKIRTKLDFQYPEGEQLFNDSLTIKGYQGAVLKLEVLKSKDPLATKWDVGSNDYRKNGLIIRSGGAIHDISLFRYDNEDYKDITSHIFGFITCDHIKKLMEKGDDQVVNDSRDGLNTYHPFIQAMKAVVEAELKKIIDNERQLREKAIENLESAKIKRLIKKNLSLLNSIARKELADLGPGPGDKKDDGVPIPPDGFNFFPETDYLVIGKKYNVKLIGELSQIPKGSQIELNTDDAIANEPDIEYSPRKFTVQESDITEGVWIKRITLIGKKVDAQRTLTATFKARIAEAVFVVTKGGGKKGKKGASGLIKDVKFDPEGDPQQRVRFIDGIIRIHTKAPSISRYYGPKGEGQEKLHCRILMSELIAEAVVGHIARMKGLAGKLVVLDKSNPQEAFERERNKLQYQYAHLIHKGFVRNNEI